MRRAAGCLAVLMTAQAVGWATAGLARAAATCPSTPSGSDPRLAEIDGRARLTWIDARLSLAARSARAWSWGWGSGVAASGVASLAVVPFVRPGDRVDWYTSAGSAAVGVVPFVLAPLDVIKDARELHAALLTLSGGDRTKSTAAALQPDGTCALLADAETRLARDAADEQRQQSWWLHAGNIAFNAGVMLFLGLGFGHWSGGAINGLAGAAVGEAIILTQPTRTIQDLDTYRAAAFTADDSARF